jgi:hypothetical protein
LVGILNATTLTRLYNPNFRLAVQGGAVVAVEFILEFIDLNYFTINSCNGTFISMRKDANNEAGVGREIILCQIFDAIAKIFNFQVLKNSYVKSKFFKHTP